MSDNNKQNNEPDKVPDENEIPDVVVDRLYYGQSAETPEEIYEAAKAGIEELWKLGQINFDLATQLANKATQVYEESKQKLQDEMQHQIVYVRKFPCALCKKEVTATRILNGYLIECGCVPAFAPGESIEDNSWYDRRD